MFVVEDFVAVDEWVVGIGTVNWLMVMDLSRVIMDLVHSHEEMWKKLKLLHDEDGCGFGRDWRGMALMTIVAVRRWPLSSWTFEFSKGMDNSILVGWLDGLDP